MTVNLKQAVNTSLQMERSHENGNYHFWPGKKSTRMPIPFCTRHSDQIRLRAERSAKWYLKSSDKSLHRDSYYTMCNLISQLMHSSKATVWILKEWTK